MRIWLVFGLAVVVAACATLPPHELNVNDIRGLRLERVEVVVDPSARLNWVAMKDQFEKSQKAAASVAAFRSYITPHLNQKARATIEPALKSVLAGSRPVAARITITVLHIPGFVEGFATALVFGPGSHQSRLSARVDIVDARTGAAVVSLPTVDAATQGGHALLDLQQSGPMSADPVERLFAKLSDRLTSWLLKA